jgi:8-oxo-dGTP pyrophosphatase MutT (NUDIX family)
MESSFTKISALLLNNEGRLLVVRGEGDSFYKAFGGKIDNQETDEECLAREVMEEGRVNLISAKLYLELPLVEVHAQPGKYFSVRFYLIEVEGTPTANPEDNTEELLWLSKSDFESGDYEIASATRDYAIPKLIADGLLK